MLDRYFKKPIFWDYFISLLLTCGITYLVERYGISVPKDDVITSLLSDLGTISFTLCGFILTLLTVLISFKSTSKKDVSVETDSLYEIFFSTSLYFETVRHLKNAIISLGVIGVIDYSLKLALDPKHRLYAYAFNIFTLLIIFLTLCRCLIILSKIIKIQRGS